MDVHEAVTSRRAVRGFTSRQIPRAVLERVLSAAAWAPSGSNLRPWRTYVLTGRPLAELKRRAGERVAAGDPWDEREYEMYPPALKSPYHERRSAFGHERYSALGIALEDWEARQRAASANWDCFGAPAALFCYIDRDMGRPQWSDVGLARGAAMAHDLLHLLPLPIGQSGRRDRLRRQSRCGHPAAKVVRMRRCRGGTGHNVVASSPVKDGRDARQPVRRAPNMRSRRSG
ncbi:nitroreductase family protein [Streptomyces sp. NPDC001851]|uniref:nitroreductase family protein n=1 Tax=Streptomyces sp. NPDC001851 TaxID=3154529 RepID=UPI00332C6802